MVPRYTAGQPDRRTPPPPPAPEPSTLSPPAPPSPKSAPAEASQEQHKETENRLPELSALMTDLPARIARLDGETLLLLGILWMLWQEKADRRLLIALAYILL